MNTQVRLKNSLFRLAGRVNSELVARGEGGTPLYGLYRYVPRNRVGFLEVLDP